VKRQEAVRADGYEIEGESSFVAVKGKRAEGERANGGKRA
jgi:hypothetical protein